MMAEIPPDEQARRHETYWAKPITSLLVSRVPTGSLNLNVDGRQVVGPLQGFGRLWHKTFRLALPDLTLTPAEVMQIWKANFPRLQPKQNRFFPVTTLDPGEIMLINASLVGMPVSTGMMVLYADEESFTLMTPQGHPESGWITFSAGLEEGGLVCQIQTMTRANDPLYEYSFRLFGSRAQDRIWVHVLEALAAYVYAEGAPAERNKQQVQVTRVCLDPRVQWSEAKNIWQNAALRTIFYTLGTPLRWLKKRLQPEKEKTGREGTV